MSASMLVTSVTKQIKLFFNGLSDLVLGPMPTDSPVIAANHGNDLTRVPISRISQFIGEIAQKRGQILEVFADEPEQMDLLLDALVKKKGMGAAAILGVEKSRLAVQHEDSMVMVMASQSAPEMLFAAYELLKSKAIDLIVLSEILLKEDATSVVRELAKLNAAVLSSETVLVLLNANTSERRLALSELQLICSHQYELSVPRYSKESNKV